MNRKMLLAGLIWATTTAFAQVTIEECYQRARENYPLIKQFDLIEKTKEYDLENASKGYLPQLMFSAKATYQSDVTEIPIDLSMLGLDGVKIPKLSQDQYGMTLDLTQTIWDGGEIRSQRKSIRTASEVQRKNVEVSLYAINERVNQLYFGILLADAQIQQNYLLKADLRRNYDQVSSYIQNGIANQADLDAVQVDQLKAEQNEMEYRTTKKAYIAMLAQLTGMELGMEAVFVKPDWERSSGREILRPELALYEAQIQSYEIENTQITSGLYPKFSLFVSGGYGKPGLDMFENSFSAYYTAGVQLSWNIGNFYTLKNRRKAVRNNIRLVETERETFLFNTYLDMIQKDETIEKYVNQLKYDDEIIRLKTAVRKASEAKIANGTISGTDLMRDVNAEQLAIQDKILHEMRLLLAVYDLKFATNN